jgi:hypothetical protein
MSGAMSKWLLIAVGALGGFCGGAVKWSDGATITAQLFPLTGEIRLKNPDPTAVFFVFYSITSPGRALNSSPAVWRSISDYYDASGNRFVDAFHEWTKLSPQGSTTELSEGVLLNPGGQLPARRSLSLGRIWNPQRVPVPDLRFDIREPSGQPVPVSVSLTLDGDYSGNGQVNAADYGNVWRPRFGSTSALEADGNIDGVIGAADYVVWRDNVGKVLPPPPLAAAVEAPSPVVAVQTMPEPSSVLLWLGVAVSFHLQAPRRGVARGKPLIPRQPVNLA